MVERDLRVTHPFRSSIAEPPVDNRKTAERYRAEGRGYFVLAPVG